ncbi:MAG: amidohydrolase [Acidobacteriota bacterium]|nr:amidohydrolase [Acidobacteriota bacterium]
MNQRAKSILFWTVLTVTAVAIYLVGRPLAAQQPPADLILINGRIVTADDARPEAQAMAVRGDTIAALGTTAEMQALAGPNTKVIDLKGQLAIPGFIEGHGHFTGLGEGLMNLNLMPMKSWQEIVDAVGRAAAAAKPGQWIVGRGWHQEKWTSTPNPNVEGFPTHESLSRVSPNNPVVLTHASGHASFVNAKAMELSAITRDTANPAGGELLHDAKGNPTGLLRETAARLVRRGVGEPAPTEEERTARALQGIELATQEALSKGVTSFQDAGSGFETVDMLKKLVDEKKLGIRLWVMLRVGNESLSQRIKDYKIVNYGDKRLTVRAIKVSIDGALGPRGAWLLEPYADKPDSRGLNTTSIESATRTAQIALEHGFQLCIHAIGDRANREVLDIYEKAFKGSNINGRDLRWRIEHAQHISPADIPRFGQLGVIASMQGIHATSDAPYVLQRLGEDRARSGAYVWQGLMKSGALVMNGTDVPVEDIDPIASFHASVARQMQDGGVFFTEQRMSRLEALKSYTINNAMGAFEEDIKGTLTPGKLADITVLSKDIMTVPEAEIRQAKVVYTIVGGKVVYETGK